MQNIPKLCKMIHKYRSWAYLTKTNNAGAYRRNQPPCLESRPRWLRKFRRPGPKDPHLNGPRLQPTGIIRPRVDICYIRSIYKIGLTIAPRLKSHRKIARLAALRERRIEEQEVRQPLLYPQQQAYLLLADRRMRRLMDLTVDIISRFVDQAPHRRGAAPIGFLENS
jgi:hypothetical protein